MNPLKLFMPKKMFRIYHADGKPENIEGASATIIRNKAGRMTAVKIGKRTIDAPIQFWELIERVEPPQRKPVNDDDEE